MRRKMWAVDGLVLGLAVSRFLVAAAAVLAVDTLSHLLFRDRR